MDMAAEFSWVETLRCFPSMTYHVNKGLARRRACWSTHPSIGSAMAQPHGRQATKNKISGNMTYKTLSTTACNAKAPAGRQPSIRSAMAQSHRRQATLNVISESMTHITMSTRAWYADALAGRHTVDRSNNGAVIKKSSRTKVICCCRPEVDQISNAQLGPPLMMRT